jgi:hypothetical protein
MLACKDWLESEECNTVAMESSGVYWKPVFNILEESMEVILVNARHIKNVPGRKTDVKDCEWIAQLLRHSLSIKMIASYDTAIEKLERKIDQRMQPYREQSGQLQSISREKNDC